MELVAGEILLSVTLAFVVRGGMGLGLAEKTLVCMVMSVFCSLTNSDIYL